MMGCQSTAVRSDRGLVCVLVDVPPQAMCEQGFGVMEEAQEAQAQLDEKAIDHKHPLCTWSWSVCVCVCVCV